jgi:hypothetical protein
MEYPLSQNFRLAVRQLFDDESVANGLLGQGVPLAHRDVPCTPDTDPRQRVLLLSKKLESFVIQMANELNELGPDELPRLKAEATAVLLVLREIQSYFPDVIGEKGVGETRHSGFSK